MPPERSPRPPACKGFTFVEMTLAVLILSILVLVLGNLLLKASRLITDTDKRSKTDIALRGAMDKVETTLLNATYFELSRTTEVIFRADRNTDPAYTPYADSDSDGIPDLCDPDTDGDATQIQPSSAQWRVGYNLKDDDDDGDGRLDMRWRIRFSTAQKTLFRDYSKNEEPWGGHEETLLTNVVSTPIFTFFGSKNTLLCATCGNTDTNNDGIVTESEIDAAASGGDGNGFVNGSTETNKIVTVGVYLDRDEGNTGSSFDSHLSIEVMPPLLYLRRRP